MFTIHFMSCACPAGYANYLGECSFAMRKYLAELHAITSCLGCFYHSFPSHCLPQWLELRAYLLCVYIIKVIIAIVVLATAAIALIVGHSITAATRLSVAHLILYFVAP